MIGIIAAQDEEIKDIKELMTDIQKLNIEGMEFYKGRLSESDVVLCKSGVGKVKATIAAVILHQIFKPCFIINIGSAGSLKKHIRVNDVVIPRLIAQYDAKAPGWEVGFKKGNPHLYEADARLLKIAEALKDEKTYFEDMVSGDRFIYLDRDVEEILSEYPSAACVEMEAGAIAQTCHFLKIPFIIIRGISDVTIEKGSEMTYEEYLLSAAKTSALYCQNFIKKERESNASMV